MTRVAQKNLPLPETDFQAGDRVQLADEEPTPEEVRQRLYFAHMKGLTGTVRRVYDEKEAWVEIDRDALSPEVLERHEETEKRMRTRWLDGLSDEARRRLSESEKRLQLRYSVLVPTSRLILVERGATPEAPAPQSVESGRRVTTDDLNTVEEEFLNRAMADPEGDS